MRGRIEPEPLGSKHSASRAVGPNTWQAETNLARVHVPDIPTSFISLFHKKHMPNLGTASTAIISHGPLLHVHRQTAQLRQTLFGEKPELSVGQMTGAANSFKYGLKSISNIAIISLKT